MPMAQRTHCFSGLHELTPDNIYTPPGTTKRTCKACRFLRTKESTKRNRESRLIKQRARRKAESSEVKREKNLKQIGWTTEAFNSTLSEQEAKCAICRKALTLEKKISGTRACADHEHCTPPKPRGILCANCNLGIGNLQDNPDIMRAAIAYVEKWR